MTTKPNSWRSTTIHLDANYCASHFPDGWGDATLTVRFNPGQKAKRPEDWLCEYEKLIGSPDETGFGPTFFISRPKGVISAWLKEQPVKFGPLVRGPNMRDMISGNQETFLTNVRLTFG